MTLQWKLKLKDNFQLTALFNETLELEVTNDCDTIFKASLSYQELLLLLKLEIKDNSKIVLTIVPVLHKIFKSEPDCYQDQRMGLFILTWPGYHPFLLEYDKTASKNLAKNQFKYLSEKIKKLEQRLLHLESKW